MARVTVEDCIDKVENRFDLVLLASHRARMISSGSQITVDRDNDKNPVVALREIAETTVSPGDLKEDLIHSLQKYVEVDEPEPDVPLIGAGAGATVDSDDTEVTSERMTEEELLKGLEGLAPPEEGALDLVIGMWHPFSGFSGSLTSLGILGGMWWSRIASKKYPTYNLGPGGDPHAYEPIMNRYIRLAEFMIEPAVQLS